MKLCLAIHGLGSPGGAETVISTMANYWSRAGVDIVMVTTDPPSPDFYTLDDRIKTRSAFVPSVPIEPGYRSLRRILRIFYYLRYYTNHISKISSIFKEEQPAVVISFLTQLNIRAIVASRCARVPIIVSERNDILMEYHPAATRALRAFTYPCASAIVVQSKRSFNHLPSSWARRSVVIPNQVSVPAGHLLGHRSLPPRDSKHIVGMGRLVTQKRFDLLISAFARLSGSHPEWNLLIYGDGPLKQQLQSQIERLGLAGRAFLLGVTSRPYESLHSADVFVLSSEFEGFPNVLCEAMALGKAVVSFDCPSGPGEIITNGKDGFLVPPLDLNALTNVLAMIMSQPQLRIQIGKNAALIQQTFSLDSVMDQWNKLINFVSGKHNNVLTQR